MLKKLRKKFIIVSMVSISIVFLSILGFINIRNYTEINKRANETLYLLEINNGKFPDIKKNPSEITKAPDESVSNPTLKEQADGNEDIKSFENGEWVPKGMSPETPFETRFFTVTLNENGKAVSINTDMIAAIDAKTAAEYANLLYENGNTKGYMGNYKYTSVSDNNDIMYIFLDCTKDLNIFRSFLTTSLLIGLLGIAMMFVLVYCFSGIAVKPVAIGYEKQKQFITDASHELKTPLTIIDASCEALEISTGENEWTRCVKEQIVRLTELTDKLVFLSRTDEDNVKTVMTDFSFSEAAEDAVKPFFIVAEATGKSLDCKIAPNLTCCGDISMIKKLISILLENAMKYSDDCGFIHVKAQRSGKSIKLTVSNTTDGIEADKLDMLFERFYRSDTSRNRKTGGDGIGLSVAKAIAELHKGKIHASSADGKTITFTVLL